ncbi:hypothetical protein V6N13_087947 [Hibiscus sabdariffa]|uniref:Uncharacterized protein n=2 Tax=Hibiscus sabdariffa TaxID=183260 RepID=A0ABR1ZDZ3_9ROSI
MVSKLQSACIVFSIFISLGFSGANRFHLDQEAGDDPVVVYPEPPMEEGPGSGGPGNLTVPECSLGCAPGFVLSTEMMSMASMASVTLPDTSNEHRCDPGCLPECVSGWKANDLEDPVFVCYLSGSKGLQNSKLERDPGRPAVGTANNMKEAVNMALVSAPSLCADHDKP